MGNKQSSSYAYQNPYVTKNFTIDSTNNTIQKNVPKIDLNKNSEVEDLRKYLYKKLLNMAPHTKVMQIKNACEKEDCYVIEMEKMNGYELFDFLVSESRQNVTDDIKRYITYQILCGLHHLHENNIIHRDLKPENIMFRNNEKKTGTKLKPYEISIIDLDSCFPTDYSKLDFISKNKVIGTPAYMAPEVLKGNKPTESSDLWSLGVILYILIVGTPPFPMQQMLTPSNAAHILKKYEISGIDFYHSAFLNAPYARDLCKNLLCFNPKHRIQTSNEALLHPWFDQIRYNKQKKNSLCFPTNAIKNSILITNSSNKTTKGIKNCTSVSHVSTENSNSLYTTPQSKFEKTTYVNPYKYNKTKHNVSNSVNIINILN